MTERNNKDREIWFTCHLGTYVPINFKGWVAFLSILIPSLMIFDYMREANIAFAVLSLIAGIAVLSFIAIRHSS